MTLKYHLASSELFIYFLPLKDHLSRYKFSVDLQAIPFVQLLMNQLLIVSLPLAFPPPKLTQRGQASVTLQPDSGLFNPLGAGVVKLTV